MTDHRLVHFARMHETVLTLQLLDHPLPIGLTLLKPFIFHATLIPLLNFLQCPRVLFEPGFELADLLQGRIILVGLRRLRGFDGLCLTRNLF